MEFVFGGGKVLKHFFFFPLRKAKRPPQNGGPGREQKSCEHLGNFKVGQSSLKIESKSDFSHSNWAHSGCLKSLDLTLALSHVTPHAPPQTIPNVSAFLHPQCSPLLFHSEQISSSFCLLRRTKPWQWTPPPVHSGLSPTVWEVPFVLDHDLTWPHPSERPVLVVPSLFLRVNFSLFLYCPPYHALEKNVFLLLSSKVLLFSIIFFPSPPARLWGRLSLLPLPLSNWPILTLEPASSLAQGSWTVFLIWVSFLKYLITGCCMYELHKVNMLEFPPLGLTLILPCLNF